MEWESNRRGRLLKGEVLAELGLKKVTTVSYGALRNRTSTLRYTLPLLVPATANKKVVRERAFRALPVAWSYYDHCGGAHSRGDRERLCVGDSSVLSLRFAADLVGK